MPGFQMTPTDTMLVEINSLLKATGEVELSVPEKGSYSTELELLGLVKEQYVVRLLKMMPKYKSLPPGIIPDAFLVAMNKRESKLRHGT